MEEMIDVLVPVYNGSKYIEKCLLSIMNQTYKNINIIVLDDGSKDNTYELIEKLSLKDSRIKLYSKKNEKNISLTRNFLLDKIVSKYFIFVDSDDYVSPTFISNLAEAINKTGAKMACCEYTIVKSFLSHSKKIKGLKIYNSSDAIPSFVLGGRGHFMLWNKLIDSSLIKDIKFDNNINYGEDMFFVLDILYKNNYKIASIRNHLYYYKFLNFKSISKGGLNDKKKAFLDILIKKEEEATYGENTRIITTWIYLTASFYLFLVKPGKMNREYRKKLRRIRNERRYILSFEAKKLIYDRKF